MSIPPTLNTGADLCRMCFGLGLALGAVLGCNASSGSGANPLEDGGHYYVDAANTRRDALMGDAPAPHDAGPDAPPAMPAPATEAGPPPNATSDDDAGAGALRTCIHDGDCQDGVFCNGQERCVYGLCQPAALPPCPPMRGCIEALRQCDCANPNMDGDAYDAVECGGSDCDDSNPRINPDAIETCAPDTGDGIDEDCNPETFHGPNGNGDQDGDGFVSDKCFNLDPMTGAIHAQGDDCDDRSRNVWPGATETCDYIDNDCNGYIDEKRGETTNDGLWNTFYADPDGDGHGSVTLETQRGCIYDKPVGYVLDANDCSGGDGDPHVYQGATEVCDGKDNDCNGKTDSDDPNLVKEFSFPETDVVCADGAWKIDQCPADKLWCGPALDRGCDTDATRLSSCRECKTDCMFSCGKETCDEITQLALGVDHSCAVTREGRAACWGRGGLGRLGSDNTAASFVPQPVLGIDKVTDIAAGLAATCAVAGSDHQVYCWGNNDSKQLGATDGGDFSTVPLRVSGIFTNLLNAASHVAVGDQHACATMQDGSLVCWGSAAQGRLGDGTTADISEPPTFAYRELPDPQSSGTTQDIFDDADRIALGSAHGCVLTLQGVVECWGDNEYGQLGFDPSNLASYAYARPVPGLGSATMIALGRYHSCALVSGQVYCWGLNSKLQLGRPSDDHPYTPTAIAGLSDVTSIATGRDFTCARRSTGAVVCWGSNDSGQLGDPGIDWTAQQTAAPIDDGGVLVAGGGSHVCGQGSNHRVSCWGSNTFGELGNGTSSGDPEPMPTFVTSLLGSQP